MAKKKSVKKNNSVYNGTLELSFQDAISPRSEGYIAKVGAELKSWSDRETSLTINQFLAEYRLPRASFYRWIESHPSLAHDYDCALTALAARREVLGLVKELDSGMIASSMSMYCPQWKQMHEWKAKLREEAHAGSGKIEIQLTQIPMTAEVTADIERKK